VTRDGNTESNVTALAVRTMIWTDRLGYSIVFHYFAMKVLGLHSSCVYHIARFYKYTRDYSIVKHVVTREK
jgi:hypothetical protein